LWENITYGCKTHIWIKVVSLFFKVRKQKDGKARDDYGENFFRFKEVKFLAKMNTVREKN
jgi:hypothetical protein